MDKVLQSSLVVIENQVEKCMAAGASLVVTNQEEYDQALIIGKKVSALLKTIEEDEKKITKPINDSLKLIRDKYRPFKARVDEVKTSIKDKMETWFKEEEKKKRIAEERITARVEKGTMKPETAINKLANMTEAKSNGGFTSVLVVEILDIKQVPAEYLIIDEAKVKEDFRSGKEIAGVKCTYEKRARL